MGTENASRIFKDHKFIKPARWNSENDQTCSTGVHQKFWGRKESWSESHTWHRWWPRVVCNHPLRLERRIRQSQTRLCFSCTYSTDQFREPYVNTVLYCILLLRCQQTSSPFFSPKMSQPSDYVPDKSGLPNVSLENASITNVSCPSIFHLFYTFWLFDI